MVESTPSPTSTYDLLTFTYDPIHKIDLDVYLPKTTNQDEIKSLPGLIYFHGGGLTAGSKRDAYFLEYLMEQCISQNLIFLSANYRLLLPCSGAHILQDVGTLFQHLSSESTELISTLNKHGYKLDVSRLGVLGASAGDYPARASIVLPTIPEEVRPKVYVNFCGMAGDLLIEHWIKAKPDTPNLFGCPYDPARIKRLLDDVKEGREGTTSDVYIKWDGDEQGRIGLLNHWYLSGEYVDYILEKPGLSRGLEVLPHNERFDAIPEEKKYLLLPLEEGRKYPPTMFIHGERDHLVPIESSLNFQRELESLGNEGMVRTIYPKEAGHGLLHEGNWPNLVPETTQIWNECVEFVKGALGG